MKTLKEQIEKAYNPFGGIYIFNEDQLRTLLDEAFKETRDEIINKRDWHSGIKNDIRNSPNPETGLDK